MKNKHPHAAVVLVLGLAMAGLHLADLLLWSEADTGFAAAGSVWLRYIPCLAAFALPYLPARRAAAQPAGLQDTNKPLGVCMALAGAALLASGVAAGNTARRYSPEAARSGPRGRTCCCRFLPVHGC